MSPIPSWWAPVVSDAEPRDDKERPNDDDDFQMSTLAAVQQLNTSLTDLGESPIVKKETSHSLLRMVLLTFWSFSFA